MTGHNAEKDVGSALRRAIDSGMGGHGWSLGQHFVHFENGHVEAISPREAALIAAAYQQGQEHERTRALPPAEAEARALREAAEAIPDDIPAVGRQWLNNRADQIETRPIPPAKEDA